MSVLGLFIALILCAGCQTAHKAYPTPNLPRAQVAYLRSDLKVIEIDGQTKSPRDKEYRNHGQPINVHLPPGEHTFLVYAGREHSFEPGTRAAKSDLVYKGEPMRYTITAMLEAGKDYQIQLRVNKPTPNLLESLKSSFGFTFSRTSSVVLVTGKEVVARGIRR